MLDKVIREAEYFHVNGGPVIPSLISLRVYLRTIPHSIYEKHVNDKKNDFAEWVEHVFNEIDLAKKIRSCKSREQMVWALDDAFAEFRIQAVLDEKPRELKQTDIIPGQPQFVDPVALQEDNKFDQYKPETVVRNEEIMKKYDDLARQMQESIRDPFPKELEQLTEQLRNRYLEIMAKISEARKAGRDTIIPALYAKQFMPKLGLAKATRDRNDFNMAKQVLDETEYELKEVMQEKEINFKKEVLALAEKKEMGSK